MYVEQINLLSIKCLNEFQESVFYSLHIPPHLFKSSKDQWRSYSLHQLHSISIPFKSLVFSCKYLFLFFKITSVPPQEQNSICTCLAEHRKPPPRWSKSCALLLCLNFLISCIRLNDPRSRRRRAGKLTLRALRSRQVNFVNGPKSQCQLQLQTRQTSKWLALADRAESREPNPNTCGNSWSKLSHDATPTAHRLASAWHWHCHCHCIRVVVVAVVARASERMSPTCSVPYASVTQCRAKEEMRSRPMSRSGSLACQRKERKTHTYADKHMDREKDEQCRHRWDWPGWARVAHENGNGTHGARLSWESVRSTQAHWSRVGVM